MTPDDLITLAALTLGFAATIALGREQRRRREADAVAKILRAVIHDYRKRILEAPMITLRRDPGYTLGAIVAVDEIQTGDSYWPGLPYDGALIPGLRLVLDPEVYPRDDELISGDPHVHNLRSP